MKKAIGFCVGAIVGGLAGVSLVLLLTPISGVELRNRLQGEADRIRAEVSRAAGDRRSELEKQLAALRAPQKP